MFLIRGQLIKSYKIGIGYPEFPLPTGFRRATTIIFNPTWTPPDEPWVESSNKVKAGEKIEAGSQLNPLGVIKIPIGLPSLIHGGKAPATLGGFASHGCVGLTNNQVQDFARVLAGLSGVELTSEEIRNYEKKRTETKNIKLDHPIPGRTALRNDGRGGWQAAHLSRCIRTRREYRRESARRSGDLRSDDRAVE